MREVARAITVAALLLAQCFAMTAAPSQKSARGTIAGRVVSENGQPHPNTSVYLYSTNRSAGLDRSLSTDDEGRFRADDLGAGSYAIQVDAPGYVLSSDTDARRRYRVGDSATLTLIKGGVITGTVTRASGEPVVGIAVQAIGTRDNEGRPTNAWGSRLTDDRGVYRIYGLKPGSYRVKAGGRSVYGYQTNFYENEVATYYPSTTRDAATEVTVGSGAEITGIDIRYRAEKGYIVSGHVSGVADPASRRLNGAVQLLNAKTGEIEGYTYIQNREQNRGFSFMGLSDGEYIIFATNAFESSPATEVGASSTPRRVVVKGADVTGIDLQLVPLASIRGRVQIQRLEPAPNGKPACEIGRATFAEEIAVALAPDMKAFPKESQAPGFPRKQSGAIDESGGFLIRNISPGRHRLEIQMPGDELYVRSIEQAAPARRNAAETRLPIPHSGLVLKSNDRLTGIVITVAEGAATVSGRVIAAQEGVSLPANLRVHLVPAEPAAADNILRYAEKHVDADGAFSLTNIAPGKYWIAARKIPDNELREPTASPLAWNAVERAKLRRETEAAGTVLELRECQRTIDYRLKLAVK